MRLGKLDNDQLDKLILGKLKHTRSEVESWPHVGVDCTAVQLGGRLAVLSTDPITSADRHLGYLTVHVSCNDAAAAGAEPIGLLVTLLIPPSAEEADVDEFANEMVAAAASAGVDIIGGHTEVTDSVSRMVTCATVLARAGENGTVAPSGMKAGDAIVLTKHAGLEGSMVIAADFADRLKTLSAAELDTARGFMAQLSVVKEGLYAASHGVHAMHDVTEGGVLGAAWEMAFASGCGLQLDMAAIPLHGVTKKMCKELSIDPYRLLSSGCMLMACPNGPEMVRGLEEIGVPSAVIGCATVESGIFADGCPVSPPEADELYKLF